MNERNIALLNDNKILEMAIYWETKGNMVAVKDKDAILNRFTEYKGLVKRSSYTMEQLEEKVYKAHGIMSSVKDEELKPKPTILDEIKGLAEDLKRIQLKKNGCDDEKKQ